LFGLLAPDLFAFVFPENSLGTLRLLSQVGVCLFMFAGGMELDLKHVKSKANGALMNTRGLMELIALNIGYDAAHFYDAGDHGAHYHYADRTVADTLWRTTGLSERSQRSLPCRLVTELTSRLRTMPR